jgi:hypothetical protein
VTLPREVDGLVMPLCQVCVAPPRQENQVNRFDTAESALLLKDTNEEVENENSSS